MEENVTSLIAEGKSDEAWKVYGIRGIQISSLINSCTQAHFQSLIATATTATGCSYIYDLTQCQKDPEEDNYEVYAMLNSTRAAIHVGNREDDY